MRVLFSWILQVRTSRKFPLQFMSIYSYENISKIAKLSPCEFPHLVVQNRENICMRKLWRIQYFFLICLFAFVCLCVCAILCCCHDISVHTKCFGSRRAHLSIGKYRHIESTMIINGNKFNLSVGTSMCLNRCVYRLLWSSQSLCAWFWKFLLL